jgi:methionyl-tRNA formyltransferase
MSIVFFGSPEFAVPSLKTLIDEGEVVAAVVTQPDKVRGRGRKLIPSPVKKCALENGIKVLTPLSMKDEAFLAEIEGLRPEFLVVVAYGRLLSKRILDIPTKGTVNVHASLLPKYRGASPVTWAIMKGDRETGVTTMLMDEGLDTGAILLKEAVIIEERDTTGSLSVKLSEAGRPLLIRTLGGIRQGTVTPEPQGDSPTEYARLLTKEDGHIDWSKGTMEIHNTVRALSPWPSAYCFLGGRRIKLTSTTPGETALEEAKEGTVTEAGADYFEVRTGDGTLRVLELQPEGKKSMSARDFLLGHKLEKGERLD